MASALVIPSFQFMIAPPQYMGYVRWKRYREMKSGGFAMVSNPPDEKSELVWLDGYIATWLHGCCGKRNLYKTFFLYL